MLSEFHAKHQESSSLENTIEFVDEWIPEKNLSRGFDLASQVARNQVGDCTEHAVLLGATSRALGHPAKVVLGIVVLATSTGITSFGHAWTEIYREGQWHLADAALHEIGEPLFYLPIGVLENEGPGYNFSLLEAIAAFPSRLIVESLQH